MFYALCALFAVMVCSMIALFLIIYVFEGAENEDTNDSLARGSLRLEEVPWRGVHLAMMFEYSGGGACSILAVYSSDALPIEEYAKGPSIVFFLNQDGKVEEHIAGMASFGGSDDKDWFAMKKDVEAIWQYASTIKPNNA